MAKVLTVLLTLVASAIACAENGVAERHEIRLATRTITPEPGLDERVRSALARAEEHLHVLLQFHRQLDAEDHRFVQDSGVLLLQFLHDHVYMGSIPRGFDPSEGRWRDLLRAVVSLEPRDKIGASLLRDPPEWAVVPRTGELRVLVEFFEDVEESRIEADLRSAEVRVEPYSDITRAVVVSPRNLEGLARLDSVKSLWPGPKPFLPNVHTQRMWTHTDRVQLVRIEKGNAPYFGLDPLVEHGVSGQGIRIGIHEGGGIEQAHEDFFFIDTDGTLKPDSKFHTTRPEASNHGTAVASIAAGTGFSSESRGDPAYQNRGHAMLAELGEYPQAHADTFVVSDAIVTGGNRVTNHSYLMTNSTYDSDAAGIDRIIRGDAPDPSSSDPNARIPARPQVWSSGNNGIDVETWTAGGVTITSKQTGYYATYATAKNAIAVGSIDTLDGLLSSFSALGPTYDGRIKPELVAPGAYRSTGSRRGLRAARKNTTSEPNAYHKFWGTSMAAPAVSGIIALMMHEYERVQQTALTNFLPSTYKAVLVHTAIDLVKTRPANREFDEPDLKSPVLYHRGPDLATGYGLVDADGARRAFSAAERWGESSIAFQDDSERWCFDVPPGSKELKVTIAWDDPPGPTSVTPATSNRLINDLDLVVSKHGAAKKYEPWTLARPGDPVDNGPDAITAADIQPAKPGVDRVNNLEMVSLPHPDDGTWVATVTGHKLAAGTSQPYSLVASDPLLDACPGIFLGEICEAYEHVCAADLAQATPTPKSIVVPPLAILPLARICRFVVDCPGCEGNPWQRCAGFEIEFGGLASESRVVMFDETGSVRSRGAGGSAQIVGVESVRPGERFFFAFGDEKGEPLAEPIELDYRLRRTADPQAK